MGIYTSNRYLNNDVHDYASEIPANEAYDAAFGCAHILADCQANDMALFESTIYSDLSEVRAVQEGYGYVNENAFTDVLKKIVEMFKKLLAKIKGIFKAFIVKLTSAFKDGKQLVDKYHNQIVKYHNWKGFKCKGIREPINSIKTAIDTLFKASNNTSAIHYGILDDKKNNILDDTKITGYGNDVDKILDADSEDLKNAIIGLYIDGATDIKDVREHIMDKLFNEEQVIDDDKVKDSSYFTSDWIKQVLYQSEDWEKEVKKYNDKIEKNINTIIDNIDNAIIKLDKQAADNPDKGISKNTRGKKPNKMEFDTITSDEKVDKGDYSFKFNQSKSGFSVQEVSRAIHALQKIAGYDQEIITTVTSEYMNTVKFAIAQARKLWVAAAAWSSGVHKESVEYVNAVAESAAEQFYTNMEAIR